MNQTVFQANETIANLWSQFSHTDQSVVQDEDTISNVVNDTNNITIDYSIYIPVKEGYEQGDYLPVRIMYWFLDEDNESCYNQGDYPSGIDKIEPYCQPLTVYTIGQIDSVIDFTVELRPSLPAGTYYIVRNIEVDPEYTWINYGREVIGSVEVLEDSTEASINLENTGTFVQPELTAPLTGLIIGDILTPVNISLVLSMLAIGLVGLFSVRKRFY
jgi:hypothetical protein